MTNCDRVTTFVCLMFLSSILLESGIKGPPIAPIRILPAQIVDLEVARMSNRVYVQFTVPDRDSDGTMPGDIERVEVYAVTTQPTEARPTETFTDDWLDAATLVATVQVRTADESLATDEPQDDVGNGIAELDSPLKDDGFVSQGEVATVVEYLTPETLVPVVIDDDFDDEEDDEENEPFGPRPFVAPPLPVPSVRTYLAFAVSSRRREGDASEMLSVPLTTPPLPPGPVVVEYDETNVRVDWDRPDLFRSSPHGEINFETEDEEDAVEASVDDGSSGDFLQTMPILPGVRTSQYVLFDLEVDGNPELVSPTPLAEPAYTRNYLGSVVEFDRSHCYAVRVVDYIDEMRLMGEASQATCVVFTDTFEPSAPTGLFAVSDAESVNLIWDPNTEVDVVGYIVLRGRSADSTFERLTMEPVEGNSYRDTDVVSGESYSYQVLALDSAVPPNVSLPSGIITETVE